MRFVKNVTFAELLSPVGEAVESAVALVLASTFMLLIVTLVTAEAVVGVPAGVAGGFASTFHPVSAHFHSLTGLGGTVCAIDGCVNRMAKVPQSMPDVSRSCVVFIMFDLKYFTFGKFLPQILEASSWPLLPSSFASKMDFEARNRSLLCLMYPEHLEDTEGTQ